MNKSQAQSLVFKACWDEAVKRGHEAASKCVPVPMIVQQRANPFDDTSPVVKTYEPVMGGVCGFAWVTVRPGNCAFAKWLTAQGYARKAYEGGVCIWISEYSQSMELKSAHAYAMADYLRSVGIKAYAGDRMD